MFIEIISLQKCTYFLNKSLFKNPKAMVTVLEHNYQAKCHIEFSKSSRSGLGV